MKGPAQGLILALALAARLAVFLVNDRQAEPRFTVPDSQSYIAAGWSLAQHGAMLDYAGLPDWGRVPVYPLILSALFAAGIATPAALQAGVLLQVLIGTLAVVLAARLAAHLAGPAAGLATGIVLAIEPSLLAYSNVVLSEMPYTLALLATALIFRATLRSFRPGMLLLLAGAVGLLPLIRPIAALLPLLFMVLMIGIARRRGRRMAGLALLLVALIPSALWCMRNRLLLGSAELHYTGPWGRAIFAHNVEASLGLDSRPSEGMKPWEFGYWREPGRSSSQAFRDQDELFVRTVRAHPIASAEMLLRQGALTLGVPEALLAKLARRDPPPIAPGDILRRLRWALDLGPLGLLLLGGSALALAGFLSLLAVPAVLRGSEPGRGALLLLLALLAVYHLGLSAFVAGQGERYRVPLIPILTILLVVAVTHALRRIGLPALHRPAPLGSDSPQGTVGGDGDRVPAARHQRHISRAVAVRPRRLPVDRRGIRVGQDPPDLLFAAAVGTEEPRPRIQDGTRADQLRDFQGARRVRQVEIDAGGDQEETVALLPVPAQPVQRGGAQARNEACAGELCEEFAALRFRHVTQHA